MSHFHIPEYKGNETSEHHPQQKCNIASHADKDNNTSQTITMDHYHDGSLHRTDNCENNTPALSVLHEAYTALALCRSQGHIRGISEGLRGDLT